MVLPDILASHIVDPHFSLYILKYLVLFCRMRQYWPDDILLDFYFGSLCKYLFCPVTFFLHSVFIFVLGQESATF
jgi:hypothetical protein